MLLILVTWSTGTGLLSLCPQHHAITAPGPVRTEISTDIRIECSVMPAFNPADPPDPPLSARPRPRASLTGPLALLCRPLAVLGRNHISSLITLCCSCWNQWQLRYAILRLAGRAAFPCVPNWAN